MPKVSVISIAKSEAEFERLRKGKGMVRRKVRRAQHLLINFVKKMGVYKVSSFDKIWRVEWFLHVINPWILFVCFSTLVISILLYSSMIATMLLVSSLFLLFFGPFRTWLLQQVYLIIASLRNLWTEQVTWEKIA